MRTIPAVIITQSPPTGLRLTLMLVSSTLRWLRHAKPERRTMVLPLRFELKFAASETTALSIELREQINMWLEL
ncbi:Unannotated [Lentimonas sp. CC4]|nr:Unannotated [Lentimonas sp. CC4]CAA6684472.1 Unannotated [Lentimonas sp. CC6]CAA7077448.1 Unannotated [Lentimonas sp. CC4]CAA7171283.1 Unannotated [Lentimonas sp. CC21]CAA7183313.1 Unannotated [Lentimonas sp. CC8]